MYILRRQHKGILLIILVMFGGLSVSVFSHCAVADDTEIDSYSFITSRFILWDLTEKMIDPNFDIHLIYQNDTNNNTGYYQIKLNEILINGTFQSYAKQSINLTETENILLLEVSINNETILTAMDIKVIGGVSRSGIERSRDKFTINLSPFEWTEKEWNIFWAIISASLLSILIGYRIVKRYRRMKGVSEVK